MNEPPTHPVLSAERIGELKRLLRASQEWDEEHQFSSAYSDERAALAEALEESAPALLSAASRPAEMEARCEALRKHCIDRDADIGNAGVDWCRVCEEEWDCSHPEHHAAGCLAAPRTEVGGG